MKWLENNNCKICFFQETFCQTDIQIGTNWTIRHNKTDSAHSRGVAIAISNTLDFTIENQHITDDARAILLNCTIEGTNVTICNIYAPSDKPHTREFFFKKIKHWINRHTDYPDNIILGGDFNCALNDNDRTRDKNNDPSRNEMRCTLRYLKLIDAWYINNKTPQYTYTAPKSGNKSRIDYIFVSDSFKHKVNYTILKHPPIKDQHKAILMGIILQKNPKGPGYWKLNAKLLELADYRMLVNSIFNDCMNKHHGLNY